MTTNALYLSALDVAMRANVAKNLNDEPGFGVMIRYALGWSDADDQPYMTPTGKRLRPLIVLLCAHATTPHWQRALPAAVAVEILHNFSLIHDDLQDNSFTRHGRPTVWQQWGMPNAINAGDAMFALAYASLSDLQIPPATLVKVWKLFNTTNIELTRGQHLDMRFEKQTRVSTEDYISMIQGKSAALIATSAQLGALIGSENEERAEHFASFGLNLGIAFQIHDDLLGIWGDSKVTGKSVATDILSRKKSLPVLYALASTSTLTELYAKADFSEADVPTAISILESCGAQQFSQETEAQYYERALASLALAKPDESQTAQLMAFVDFLFQRTY